MLVLVGFVLDPAQPVLTRPGFDIGTRVVQQRPQNIQCAQATRLRHGRQSGHTGATQQLGEQGLGLIIAMLRQQQQATVDCSRSIGKRGIAGRPRRALHPKRTMRSEIDPHHLQRNPQ